MHPIISTALLMSSLLFGMHGTFSLMSIRKLLKSNTYNFYTVNIVISTELVSKSYLEALYAETQESKYSSHVSFEP